MMNLDTIQVLYREPNTLSLYGIPYRMRPGQTPSDLARAYREHGSLPPGYYGSPRVNLSDWIYLGQPGWWGDIAPADQARITAWLEEIEPVVPRGPFEWTDLTEDWT
jgi:hypothetical protein